MSLWRHSDMYQHRVFATQFLAGTMRGNCLTFPSNHSTNWDLLPPLVPHLKRRLHSIDSVILWLRAYTAQVLGRAASFKKQKYMSQMHAIIKYGMWWFIMTVLKEFGSSRWSFSKLCAVKSPKKIFLETLFFGNLQKILEIQFKYDSWKS